ncbi:MAG: NADH-quinone oxidoreductase subunit M [Lysobacterales bacterium]|nr:NADH-quinone oxidoreductase subunit M [Rhodanobacteraceae bacterium]
MFADWPLLSLFIWLPIAGAVAVLVTGDRNAGAAKWLALLVSLATLALCIPLWSNFDASTSAMQFVERSSWIPAFAVEYHLGIDGFSLPLIVLTSIVTVLVLIAGWEVIDYKPSQYVAAFLALAGLMNGVFAAQDALLFYVFFEGMLIPMFIIIGIWGGPRRVYASLKFFLYTFLGSVFMLLGLIYLYLKGQSFQLADLQAMSLTMTEQTWVFFAFLLAFAVKIPMWPVHTWLPDAHVEAPTGGSMVLAAVMLKVGGYGFLRFSLPIAPDASAEYAWLIIALSLVAVVYIGFVALAQQDMKKLIAYSSISHMGFVTIGLFIAIALVLDKNAADTAALGMQGAMVQMISHGFVSAAMFGAVGVLYDRVHSRQIADYGGVVNTMPWFSAFVVLFAMANCGLPGTSGFVGEFMVILATVKMSLGVAALAGLTLILGAAYTLWLVKRVIFGDVANTHVAELKDLNSREWVVMGTLAFFVLLIGLWPDPLIKVMQSSVEALIQHVTASKLIGIPG